MVPRRRAVSLTEAIEDIRQKLRLDAAAGIGNANLERASGHARRHHDVAARGRELERVAEEVDKHLLEALDVATKRRLGNGRQLNVDLTSGRERADRLDDAANQVRRVDGVEIERPASAVHLRKIEQVVHEFGLPRGIPVNRFDSLRQHFDPSNRHAASKPSREWHSAGSAARAKPSIRTRPSADWRARRPIAHARPARRAWRDPVPSTVLGNRHQQRLALVVEVHGRAEAEFQHAHRSAFDHQGQRGERCKAVICRKTRRHPVLLMRVGQ